MVSDFRWTSRPRWLPSSSSSCSSARSSASPCTWRRVEKRFPFSQSNGLKNGGDDRHQVTTVVAFLMSDGNPFSEMTGFLALAWRLHRYPTVPARAAGAKHGGDAMTSAAVDPAIRCVVSNLGRSEAGDVERIVEAA